MKKRKKSVSKRAGSSSVEDQGETKRYQVMTEGVTMRGEVFECGAIIDLPEKVAQRQQDRGVCLVEVDDGDEPVPVATDPDNVRENSVEVAEREQGATPAAIPE